MKKAFCFVIGLVLFPLKLVLIVVIGLGIVLLYLLDAEMTTKLVIKYAKAMLQIQNAQAEVPS